MSAIPPPSRLSSAVRPSPGAAAGTDVASVAPVLAPVAGSFVGSVVGPLVELLVPRRCVLCRRPGPGLCETCATTLPAPPDLRPPPGMDGCRALFSYDGDAARLVAELKFRNHRDAVRAVGRALSVFVRRSDPHVDLVTWAPTSATRRRRRGYDQAAMLATAVGRGSGLPTRSTLRRRPGDPQTGADRGRRLVGPSFSATRPVSGHVVVVDDVCTTGATLSAAAVALRRAGAARVSGLVLATTP